MEDGIKISEDAGHYRPLADASDDSRLKQLGYRQELSRSLSAISNFSVTFSIISVLTGLNTTFSTGLTYGGPLTMVYGWPIIGMLTLVVGLAMAEICSSYPTSGGLYFWSAKLCGNEWGPFASWITGCMKTRSQVLNSQNTHPQPQIPRVNGTPLQAISCSVNTLSLSRFVC